MLTIDSPRTRLELLQKKMHTKFDPFAFIRNVDSRKTVSAALDNDRQTVRLYSAMFLAQSLVLINFETRVWGAGRAYRVDFAGASLTVATKLTVYNCLTLANVLVSALFLEPPKEKPKERSLPFRLCCLSGASRIALYTTVAHRHKLVSRSPRPSTIRRTMELPSHFLFRQQPEM